MRKRVARQPLDGESALQRGGTAADDQQMRSVRHEPTVRSLWPHGIRCVARDGLRVSHMPCAGCPGRPRATARPSVAACPSTS